MRRPPPPGTARRLTAFALCAVLPGIGGCATQSAYTPPEPSGRSEAKSSAGPVTAHFLGASSILFRDGRTTILIDGFVSRPGLRHVTLGAIRPDSARIRQTLKRLEVDSIAAVFCTHSHYDHCLDAPVFAGLTGADLIGSPSTRNLGRGSGLDDSRLPVVGHGDTLRYGEFHLTFVRSRHDSPYLFRGAVTAPLVPPDWSGAWRSGMIYSVLIRHRERTILVHGTAGYQPGALDGRNADVVYLGMGGLGRRGNRSVDLYWNEVVRERHAQRVFLVHWDNFFRSLDKPLQPMPLQRFEKGLEHIRVRAARDSVEVRVPVLWEETEPFAGLRPTP